MTTFTQFLRTLQREATVTDTATRPDGAHIAHLSLTVNDRPYFPSTVTLHDDGTVSGTLRLGTARRETTTEEELRNTLNEYAAPLQNYTLRLELTGDITEDPPKDPAAYWYPHIEFDNAPPMAVADVIHDLEMTPPSL